MTFWYVLQLWDDLQAYFVPFASRNVYIRSYLAWMFIRLARRLQPDFV